MIVVEETDNRFYLKASTIKDAGMGVFAKEPLKKGDYLEIIGARENNLKSINVQIPFMNFIIIRCITTELSGPATRVDPSGRMRSPGPLQCLVRNFYIFPIFVLSCFKNSYSFSNSVTLVSNFFLF